MNDRIQELAYDAEELADGEVDTGSEFHPAFCRIFAELIVRECLRMADRRGAYEVMDDIIEYFGLEPY